MREAFRQRVPIMFGYEGCSQFALVVGLRGAEAQLAVFENEYVV